MSAEVKPERLRQIIGQNAKRRRQELGYTQQAVADAAGVSQPLVAQVESGKRINLRVLCDISRALKCPPMMLLHEHQEEFEKSA